MISFLSSRAVLYGGEDLDFLKYRDYGHMSGFIANYLSRPVGQLAMEPIGEFKLTFYWITRERPQDGPKTESIVVLCPETAEESPVEVSRSFKRRLDREGTGLLEDGRIINVIRRNERRKYLDISMRARFGMGSRNNPLKPLVSVAVNDRHPKLKFGDWIYIPDVEGAPLPNGSRHNGIFHIDDTGQAIAMNQIDVFIFVRNDWPGFQKYIRAHSKRFFVFELYRSARAQPGSPEPKPSTRPGCQAQ